MADNRERVVLIHGLAETPVHMRHIAMASAVSGYSVGYIAYPSTLAPIESLLENHIVPGITAHTDASRLHFVTHSLGGVLLHACLQKRLPANLGRVVMQAPGLHGSDALEVFRRNSLFSAVFGPAAFQSGTGPDGFAHTLTATARYELGVIAGCVSTDPIANLFVAPPHDGKLNVGRTRLNNMTDHIVLPTSHDGMMHDPLTLFQTIRFLKRGAFLHLTSPAEREVALDEPDSSRAQSVALA